MLTAIRKFILGGIGARFRRPAPPPAPSSSQESVFCDLNRGINLANALEAPAEGEWGVTIQQEYFRLIREAGFTTVRVPICWSTRALEAPPYTIDAKFFRRIDWVIARAKRQKLNVILDFQNYIELFEDPGGHEERFLGIWRQISERYQHQPPSIIFELLNEPHGNLDSKTWNRMLARALGVVRAANPTRTVIVGPVNWNDAWELPTLTLPEDDRHLLVTFHFYDPKKFTHQGAEWVPGSEPWLGTAWEGAPGEKAAIERVFADAAEWGKQRGRPMHLGEFGAYGKAESASRIRWTRHVARCAEAQRIPWAYWEFCSNFGVYDATRKKWRRDLMAAMMECSV